MLGGGVTTMEEPVTRQTLGLHWECWIEPADAESANSDAPADLVQATYAVCRSLGDLRHWAQTWYAFLYRPGFHVHIVTHE